MSTPTDSLQIPLPKRLSIGLASLCLSEMWERFSYAGMRAILILYLTLWLLTPEHYANVWGLDAVRHTLEAVFGTLSMQALAFQLYGLYVGFFYFTPVLGGYVADRCLGARRTIVMGAIVMSVAQFCLATDRWFVVGLVLMIIGGGLFKPNISVQVGRLFDAGDTRRDRAFSLFYVAINVGTFLSPLICGTLGERWGWHAGFLAAGVGMIVGLLTYLAGTRYLPKDPVYARPARVEAQRDRSSRGDSSSRIVGLFLVAAIVPLFWAAYEQKSGSVILWTKQQVNLNIGFIGHAIPVSWILILNPVFIFLFVPLLNVLWGFLGRRGKAPSSALKMGLGCVFAALAYAVLAIAAAPRETVGLGWDVLFMALLTAGETLLSPIGLSLFSRLAPVGFSSLVMALWFFSMFLGNYASGAIASAAVALPRSVYFGGIACLPAFGAIALFVSSRFLNRILVSPAVAGP